MRIITVVFTLTAVLSLGSVAVAQLKPSSYRRSNQKAPTLERYREIQQALIDLGYLNGPADGKWGPASVEAVKRFQKDRSYRADGKLGALTLTALGLGPRREAAPLVASKPGEAPAVQVE